MAKELNLNVRMDGIEMDALKRAAADDDRPVSALVRRVLIVWLKEGGWLAERRQVAAPAETTPHGLPKRRTS